ncbi:MAG: class I SAM-dependent methyltransferase [Cyanobacteriota bacterium]|nr:class I SAM-dependent methyltransferase [Cyanobacteriota bacterium]
MNISKLHQQIGSHWSAKSTKSKGKSRFWQSPTIIKHINKRVCGTSVKGRHRGLTELVKNRFPGRVFKHGVSVGCGTGNKEMSLIQQGLVEKFDLFELSEQRIKTGRIKAEELAIAGRVNFILGDALSVTDLDNRYDFINWTSSLHHMLNVRQAVEWSFNVLEEDGVFYMDEYIGPDRLQFTDEMLKLASEVRRNLPGRYLRNPRKPEQMFPRDCKAPDLGKLKERDPSEAANSSMIIGAVRDNFPDAKLIMTGGIVYFIALNDLVGNFNEKEEDDICILKLLLRIDDLLSEAGYNLCASCMAVK